MITTQNNFTKRIKAETRAAHEHIEQSYLTRGIIRQSILMSEYIELLKRFLSFYAPCEAQIKTINFWKKEFLNMDDRYKTHLLQKDLKYLNISLAEINNLSTYQDIPTLNQDAQILGYLYVVEGSTLGGQILGKQLTERFGFSQNAGAAFFNSYGKEKLGLMWKNLQNTLDTFVDEFPEKERIIIESANSTFSKLDKCLSEGF